MSYKTVILFVLLAICAGTAVAQSFHEYKRIRQIYKVNPASTVDISNKYGKINVKTWQKDSLLLNIVVRIKSADTEKAKKIAADINFDLTQNSFYFAAKTNIGAGRQSFISDLKNFISKDNSISIDYDIFVPSYIDLVLTNKYGDINIDEFEGKLKVEIANGQITAQKLGSNNEIDIKFGKARIYNIENGTLVVNYDSQVDIKNAGYLTINSNSAAFTIGQAKVLRLNSKRDTYSIQSAEYLYGNTYFSSIQSFSIAKEMNLEMTYGKLTADIQRSATFVDLTAKRTTITLNLPRLPSYQLKAVHLNTELHYPANDISLSQKVITKDAQSFTETSGKTGSGKFTDIKIAATDSEISLIHILKE